jgi:hypothetical protein
VVISIENGESPLPSLFIGWKSWLLPAQMLEAAARVSIRIAESRDAVHPHMSKIGFMYPKTGWFVGKKTTIDGDIMGMRRVYIIYIIYYNHNSSYLIFIFAHWESNTASRNIRNIK